MSALKLLSVAIFIAACPAVEAGLIDVQWDCGGPFVSCSAANAPIQLEIDTTGNATTYSANGLQIENAVLLGNPATPHQADAFSFAFSTGASAFAIVEDKTYEGDNNGSNAEDIQSTSVSGVSTAASYLIQGDIQLSFDTFYGNGALPADYQTYLGQQQATGYVLLDYNPNETITAIRTTSIPFRLLYLRLFRSPVRWRFWEVPFWSGPGSGLLAGAMARFSGAVTRKARSGTESGRYFRLYRVSRP